MHRLAFLYMTGSWPIEVDHKNNIRYDNRWSNLRECTHSQNGKNRKGFSKTGIKGVYEKNGKYIASITLGTFDTIKEAQCAYNEAATKYHGEFAHINRENSNVLRP